MKVKIQTEHVKRNINTDTAKQNGAKAVTIEKQKEVKLLIRKTKNMGTNFYLLLISIHDLNQQCQNWSTYLRCLLRLWSASSTVRVALVSPSSATSELRLFRLRSDRLVLRSLWSCFNSLNDAKERRRYAAMAWEAPVSVETNVDRMEDALDRDICFEETTVPETETVFIIELSPCD